MSIDLKRLQATLERDLEAPIGPREQRRFRRCVGRMPQRMRQVVTLRHVYDMRAPAIAARLALDEALVDELLVQAVVRLRREVYPVTLIERARCALREVFP